MDELRRKELVVFLLGGKWKFIILCKLILRKSYDQIPPREDYSVTELGKTLIPIMESLFSWGMECRDKFDWMEKLKKF